MCADLTFDEVKTLINEFDEAELLVQLNSMYGQSSSSDQRIFEILEDENQLWFKDKERQLIQLRRLKNIF
jgi:hypothetical protein